MEQHVDQSIIEKLDWVFTSSSCALSFPDIVVKVLGRPLFDHSPHVITIDTGILRSPLFRFENYWLNFPDFKEVVALHWNSSYHYANSAQTVNAKFKQVRAWLKKWSRELSKLNKLINNSNYVLALLVDWKIKDLSVCWKVPFEGLYRSILLSY